jgi:hypothetical protein
MVSGEVKKIEDVLLEAVDLQKDYVDRICATCEAPCCLRVHYPFNAKDILFLRLTGRRLIWKRDPFTKKGCWFLGKLGCILEPTSKPFLCQTYICHDLETEMKRCDPGLLTVLEEKFKAIDQIRSQLQKE